mmetsp:Transcript_24534/g.62569  ORF Transcript_24534/g.62569 Transcript_24534/m.62569 type:complete len:260 (+) Transcript_24534:249-1028(+)
MPDRCLCARKSFEPTMAHLTVADLPRSPTAPQGRGSSRSRASSRALEISKSPKSPSLQVSMPQDTWRARAWTPVAPVHASALPDPPHAPPPLPPCPSHSPRARAFSRGACDTSPLSSARTSTGTARRTPYAARRAPRAEPRARGRGRGGEREPRTSLPTSAGSSSSRLPPRVESAALRPQPCPPTGRHHVRRYAGACLPAHAHRPAPDATRVPNLAARAFGEGAHSVASARSPPWGFPGGSLGEGPRAAQAAATLTCVS